VQPYDFLSAFHWSSSDNFTIFMSRTLRRKYYDRKMEGLRVSNPRNWWRSVKQLTGQTVNNSEPLIGLANQLHDGDVQALADSVRIASSRA